MKISNHFFVDKIAGYPTLNRSSSYNSAMSAIVSDAVEEDLTYGVGLGDICKLRGSWGLGDPVPRVVYLIDGVEVSRYAGGRRRPMSAQIKPPGAMDWVGSGQSPTDNR